MFSLFLGCLLYAFGIITVRHLRHTLAFVRSGPVNGYYAFSDVFLVLLGLLEANMFPVFFVALLASIFPFLDDIIAGLLTGMKVYDGVLGDQDLSGMTSLDITLFKMAMLLVCGFVLSLVGAIAAVCWWALLNLIQWIGNPSFGFWGLFGQQSLDFATMVRVYLVMLSFSRPTGVALLIAGIFWL